MPEFAAEESGGGPGAGTDPEERPGPAESVDVIDDAPPPASRRKPRRIRPQRLGGYLADLGRGVYRKGEQDQIFFLAGAISFNILIAFLPLLLTIMGVAGATLRFLEADAQQTLLDYVSRSIPSAVNVDVGQLLEGLAEQSTGLLSIGTLIFLWTATRLVGTLRAVLREIFDLPEGRGVIAGKLFDVKMVLAAGTLFALNIVLTLGLRLSAGLVAEGLHLNPDEIPFIAQASRLWPQLVAFGTIWMMFLLVYRYLPPRRIKWYTAAIAATFTAIIGEALKYGFSWYVTGIADFRSTWGNIATFVILVIWIYYTALVFILGGQLAQVVTMQRIRKRQKERLT
ncbi:MAG: YihY/virulence factor BrkB family protein [Gemmatimonadota bacterium]